MSTGIAVIYYSATGNVHRLAHLDEIKDTIQEATVDDLEWADGFAFGTPTRYGNVSAQLKQFLDQTGPLWMAGKLADKAATSFTSAINHHA